jgi:hypothetical protein
MGVKVPTMTDEFKRYQQADRNRRNTKIGKKGQDIAMKTLAAAGYVCIEPIETGWTIIRKYDPRTKKSVIVSAFPKEKVSGDIKAIDPTTGKAVHVECKAVSGNLKYSELDPHQVKALDMVVKSGAISILAWVRGFDCKLYHWPIDGFGPGKGLRWE